MARLRSQRRRAGIGHRLRRLVLSAGQGLTDYALILLFMVLVVVGVVSLIGSRLTPMVTRAHTGL